MKAALYVLQYIYSTHNFGISFSFRNKQPIHVYRHQPDESDIEAFSDAVPPKKGQEHLMTTYSNACWVSQIGNAIPHNVEIPLFKFRSMSSAILYRMGGPISWKSMRQDQTSLSSCEAKIYATSESAKITVGVCNLADGFDIARTPLFDNSQPTISTITTQPP